MKKGNNIPIVDSKEKSFPLDKQNIADNGNNVPNSGIEYTFKSSAISKKESGKTITLKKDLEYLKDPNYTIQTAQDVGKSFKRIFDKYDLTYDELGELVGISGKTLEHYINGYPCKEGDSPHSAASSKKDKEKTVYKKSGKVDVVTLIKCAEVFSNIPDKEGNYNRITLDHLTGLTAFSSVDNELIHEQIGLDDEAIERLRQMKTADDILKSQHAKYIGENGKILTYIIFNLRLPIINLFIKSKQLLRLVNVFWRYTFPRDFLLPVYEDKKGKLQPIPYSDKYGGSVLLASDIDSMNDNIPLDLDSSFSRALSKQQMDILFNEISDDFYELQEKDPDKYIKNIFF